jgi:hypothetical protein
MDGVKLARAVHERWPHVELIITSGRTIPKVEIPDDGIFIPKPYNCDQFVSVLDKMARRLPN